MKQYEDSDLISWIDRLGALDGVTKKVTDSDSGATYLLEGKNFNIEIVAMSKWFGVSLNIDTGGNRRWLNFSTDTDLYDVQQAKYQKLKNYVRNDIVEVLMALAEGRILVGKYKRKPAMIVSLQDEYHRFAQGRVIDSMRIFPTPEKAKKGGTYEPFTVS